MSNLQNSSSFFNENGFAIIKVDQDHGTVVMYPKTQNFGLIKHVYKPNLLIEENNLPKNIVLKPIIKS